ncbi:MAG: EEP domain-containing protein, partial [Mesorhizobium sp.]|nr:EEP domain-containing protein [Mesorhizobium sp.]
MHQRSQSLPKSLLAAIRKSPSRYTNPDVGQNCTTIASYNIHKCVGTDRRFDPKRIVDVVCELDADLVALQEADERFGNRQGLLDLQALKERANLVPVDLKSNLRSHGWHGNVILARDGTVRDVNCMTLPGLEPRGALI